MEVESAPLAMWETGEARASNQQSKRQSSTVLTH
jgi:hypothetical protein